MIFKTIYSYSHPTRLPRIWFAVLNEEKVDQNKFLLVNNYLTNQQSASQADREPHSISQVRSPVLILRLQSSIKRKHHFPILAKSN